MPDIDLAALAAVAEAATPGPWQVLDSIHGDPIVHQVGKGFLSGGGVATAFHGEDYGCAVAAHIAAFDPPTVLALIAEAREAERLRGEVDRAHRTLDRILVAARSMLGQSFARDIELRRDDDSDGPPTFGGLADGEPGYEIDSLDVDWGDER
jgi:hypothetical protein